MATVNGLHLENTVLSILMDKALYKLPLLHSAMATPKVTHQLMYSRLLYWITYGTASCAQIIMSTPCVIVLTCTQVSAACLLAHTDWSTHCLCYDPRIQQMFSKCKIKQALSFSERLGEIPQLDCYIPDLASIWLYSLCAGDRSNWR